MSQVEIEFADHRKFRLGDFIWFYVPGSIRLRGTIIEIGDDGMVKVDPYSKADIDAMPEIEKRNGRIRCREYGIAGGFILGRTRRPKTQLKKG